ncbi:MAG: hypothetical protein AAFZ58_14605 [Pseudomonadota bacterium]
MSSDPDVKALLIEIRDNQRLSLERQEEHLAVAREQMERARDQIETSLKLQKEAVERAKQIGRVAVPGIAICLALIIFLLIRFF